MSGVTVIDHGWNAAVDNVNSLSGGSVKAGFPSEGVIHARTRVGSGHPEYQSIPDLATVAFWLEFGTIHFDGWPFMRNAMDQNLPVLTRLGLKLSRKVTDGEMSATQALGLMGEKMVALVRREIRNLRVPANAASTIQQKKSSNPMIDTGQLIQSVQRHVQFNQGNVI